MTKGVSSTHPTYDKLAPKWQRCSDVVDGQDAMQTRGEAYLAKLTDEEDASFKARVRRSDFFNATWRSIAGLTGLAFRKPPTVEVPTAIEAMLDDINLAGRSLDDLAKSCVEDMLEYGAFGLMVEHPPMPEGVTAISQAAAEQMGLRPSIQYYEIEDVINWRYSRINNRWTLSMVVLKEETDVSTDEFERKCEDRYRVLDLVPNAQGAWTCRVRVFRVDEATKKDELLTEDYPLMRGQTLSEIPFKIVGELDEPPLIDLVDANVAHYQINSDYRHGLHFTGMPTLFLAGITLDKGEKIYIGGQAAITSTDPQAKGSYIEFTGQGLSETREALKSLEQRMAVLGARMIADETHKGAETLGGTKIKRAGENGILASIVIEVSDAVEWALGVFCDWVGVDGSAVKYEINRDFNPAGLDAQQLTALVGAVQAGRLSDAEFYDLMQRHDVVASDKPYDEHQAEIEMQGPSAPVVGVAA